MIGYSYLDTVNGVMVKVNFRYPEDFAHCVGVPSMDDFWSYIEKHPDEHDYLIGEHELDKRLLRYHAIREGARDLAYSKSLDVRLKEKLYDPT